MRSLLVVVLLTALLAPLAVAVNIEGPFPAKSGERCIVCNAPLTSKDSAYVVEGRRVAVSKLMEAQFLQNPLHYVTMLRPEATGLDARPEASFASAYLWTGVFVLIGLMFGGACAQMAMAKGLSKWPWFVLGFLFSLPAVLVLAGRPALVRKEESGS